MYATPRDAASVILLRPGPERGYEVFLLRRRRGASFMASAFVFPGGAAEPGDAGDLRVTAARELFEEAGVLLATGAVDVAALPALRDTLHAGEDAHAALAARGLSWDAAAFHPWSHWITPSIEPKRFSARFFVCELPGAQTPSFDDVETVDQAWVRPSDAIERAFELKLPPPQLRTMWELSRHDTIAEVLAAGRARADEPHPIMPRLRAAGSGDPLCLLLPWDPEYTVTGTGDAMPLTYTPRWATGPSRFILEDSTWRHVAAPGSTSAG